MSGSNTIGDRFVYGVTLLPFGAVIGSCAGLAGSLVSTPARFSVAALVVTLAFFFVVGFAWCDRGTDFVAMCALSLLCIFSIGVQTPLYEPGGKDFSPRWCLVTLLVWLALIMCALLWF